MASQRDVKNRIESVKNIAKITRAMEMVAAARLRRAEQRIAHLRPYAGAIRRMTRQAAEAAGGEISQLPILQEHDAAAARRAAAGHRRPRPGRRLQLADPARRHARRRRARGRGQGDRLLRVGPARRLVAGLPRPRAAGRLRRLHGPPGVRQRARDRRRPHGRLRRRQARPRRDLLQRLRLAARAGGAPRDAAAAAARDDPRGRRGRGRRRPRDGVRRRGAQAGARRVRARARRRSCSASSPTTSRSRSTGRCWSRPRRSTARA